MAAAKANQTKKPGSALQTLYAQNFATCILLILLKLTDSYQCLQTSQPYNIYLQLRGVVNISTTVFSSTPRPTSSRTTPRTFTRVSCCTQPLPSLQDQVQAGPDGGVHGTYDQVQAGQQARSKQTQVRELQEGAILDILYSLLRGTNGEEEEGCAQHALHWDWLKVDIKRGVL
jgi:hypothetical protein